MQRGQGAGREPDQNCQHRRGADELERARKPQRDLCCDGVIVNERAPEIAVKERGQIVDVLIEQRRIEAELVAQLRDGCRIGSNPTLRKQELRGITGNKVDGKEHQARHDKDQSGGNAYPAEHVAQHHVQPALVCSKVMPELKVSAPGRFLKPVTSFAMAYPWLRQARPAIGVSLIASASISL